MAELSKVSEKLNQLIQQLATADKLLILTHDNPDPDSMASASALRYLVEHLTNTKVTVAYSGVLGRAENRAMLKLLELGLTPINRVRMEQYPVIALVDTQPKAGNNALPAKTTPAIIIDHHPLRSASTKAKFHDIRKNSGATATIMTQYLRAAELVIPANIAIALYYGILSETQDLGREASEDDVDSFIYLFPKVNQRLLSKIKWAKVPRQFYDVISVAVDNAFVYRNVVGAKLGHIQNPDMVSLVADFLMRLERMTWAVVTGVCSNRILISVRSSNTRARAGRLVRKALAGKGTAGGHTMSSGGQVDVSGIPPEEHLAEEEVVMNSLLDVLGVKDLSKLAGLLTESDK